MKKFRKMVEGYRGPEKGLRGYLLRELERMEAKGDQILATIYVYYDSKHYGFGHSMWIVALLLGVIGLALYAYRLHQLKMKQEGRIVKNGLSARTLIALGSIALLSGCFLWQWSLATSIQRSGTVGGTTYGPLSESYEIQAVHPDTILTVQCKSVQAVQIWISTKDEFSNWKMLETIKLLAQDLGSDVTISVNLKTAGTYVVIIGKAAGYVVTSYNVKIATDAYPMRIQGGILFFGGAVTLAIAIVGLVRHSKAYLKADEEKATEQERGLALFGLRQKA